ncbi:hypothetical protein MPER_08628, partial [Moniliophthora perniciosa FA553]
QPSHAEAKELLGVVQLEMGDVDAAKQTALQHYQAAIDIMSVTLKGKERAMDSSNDDDLELRNNIVRAYISQVEIWMDPSYDLWQKRHAKIYLLLLYTSSRGNAEALQTLGSVRMSQHDLKMQRMLERAGHMED